MAAETPPAGGILELGCGVGRVTRPLTAAAVEAALAAAGLPVDAYLTDDGTWARARPAVN